MISILIATHEDLGGSLLKSAGLIVGEQNHARALSLERGDGIREFEIGRASCRERVSSPV